MGIYYISVYLEFYFHALRIKEQASTGRIKTVRFDNLYENTHRKNTSGAGKLRMFCIFILVAGVTALAIWKMIPSAPEKQPAPGEPEQKQLQQSAPPENKEENNNE